MTLALVAFGAPAAGCRDVLSVDEFSIGDWVENPCGARQVPVDGRCQDVGVDICGQGFTKNEDGGCTAILPADTCPPGWVARVGSRTCAFAGDLCGPGRQATLSAPVGQTVYVDAAAPAEGDGTEERPFSTIDDALASSSGELTILLAAGVYRGDVKIRGRRAVLVGLCTDRTTLEGTVAFGPGSDGSRVGALAITGSSGGITVSGAADIDMETLWIHDVGGHGIVLDDVAGATSGRIAWCLIERARDAGISAHGATLSIEDTQVANTLPLRDGGRAVGVLAGASPVFRGSDPTVRAPATLALRRVVIQGSRGDGILLDPANAEIADTVISDVAPDERGRAAGLETRAHTVGRIPTSLVVTRSLIEGAQDVGVRSWNADVSLDETVVRDVGSARSGRCRGNGIRARYDLVRDRDLGTRLVVRRSVIEATHQAALHVEGGDTVVEDSIVRGTRAEPCRDDFGDGLAAYASPVGPGTLVVRRSRVERSARAGLASVGGLVTAEASVFECNALGVAGSNIAVRGSLCGCDGAWKACMIERTAVPSSLFGGRGCNSADDTVCFRQCSGSAPGATAWVFDHDEIASVLTDDQGCADIEGAPLEEPCITAQVTEGYANSMGMAPARSTDAPPPERTDLIPIALNDISMDPKFFGPRDLRNGPLLVVRACRAPKTSEGTHCAGLTGITVDLAPGSAQGPLYPLPSGIPDRTQMASVTQDTFFANVPPGSHVVTLRPPPGKSLACAIEAAGWKTDRENAFRVHVEPSFSVFGLEVACTLSDP
jgi:hypothetical protein